MTLQSSGAISIGDLRTEFDGGTGAISLGDFYRGGSRVPTSSTTTGVAASGAINIGSFYSKRNALDVTYEIIGGGGGGGGGTANRPAQNGYHEPSAIAGDTGGTSTIKQGTTTLVSAPGGTYGIGATTAYMSGRDYFGTNGTASYYGAGGARGLENQHGTAAPNASYGAGGGGAGGDDYSTYDEPGYPGQGGGASTRKTGTLVVDDNTTLTVYIADGGIGGNSSYDGGKGAGGYCKLTYTKSTGSNVTSYATRNSTTNNTIAW